MPGDSRNRLGGPQRNRNRNPGQGQGGSPPGRVGNSAPPLAAQMEKLLGAPGEDDSERDAAERKAARAVFVEFMDATHLHTMLEAMYSLAVGTKDAAGKVVVPAHATMASVLLQQRIGRPMQQSEHRETSSVKASDLADALKHIEDVGRAGLSEQHQRDGIPEIGDAEARDAGLWSNDLAPHSEDGPDGRGLGHSESEDDVG